MWNHNWWYVWCIGTYDNMLIYYCRILLCLRIYSVTTSSMYLLLFFEPSSIAFETLQVLLTFFYTKTSLFWSTCLADVSNFNLQAIVVHVFQLLDIWMHHAGDSANCRLFKILNMSSAGDFRFSFQLHLLVKHARVLLNWKKTVRWF